MAKAHRYPRVLSFPAMVMFGLAVALRAIGAGAAGQPPDLEATFKAAERFTYGGDRKPLAALQQLVVYANSQGQGDARGFQRRLAERMASLLTSHDATDAAKAFVCGQIAAVATEQQAPALASLLSNKDLAQPALSGLAQIPGRSIDRILRNAVTELKGNARIASINALGQRRDGVATEILVAALAGTDEESACAAAAALGRIRGEAAAIALQKSLPSAKVRLRSAIIDACFECAKTSADGKAREAAAALFGQLLGRGESAQVRMAAFRGLVLSNPQKAAASLSEALASGDAALENMAIRLVPEVGGPDAAQSLAQSLRTASPPMQKALLGALAGRREPAVRAAVAAAAAASSDQAVRIAALTALGDCGDETSVGVLAERVIGRETTAEGEAARNSLVRLRGPRVNEILTGMLARGDAPQKIALIRILGARNAVGVTADLKRAAEDVDRAVRKESWKALSVLGKESDVPSLVDLLVLARGDDRGEGEVAIVAILKKPDRSDVRAALEKLAAARAPGAQASIIRIVSAVGNDLALPALRRAVLSDEADARNAAVRGLAAWPTPAPFEDLVELARHAKEPDHRVLALRGAIRLAGKLEGRTPAQMAGSLAELMQLSRRPAERKAVLAELGRCPTLEALLLAREYLVDAEVATEAGVAMSQVAFAIRDAHRDDVVKILSPLLVGERDPIVVGGAAKVLIEILKPVNLALGATATNPDGLAADGDAGGPQAAIDGDLNTYWDEVDGADQYRLKVAFRQPAEVSSINIVWHPYPQHQAKNFDVLCDGKIVKQIRGAECFENQMFRAWTPVRCTSVELVIPGKNGLVSPCIHELQIFGDFPSKAVASGTLPSLPSPRYSWKRTDKELALFNGDRLVWQWNRAANLPKPYFHPVALTDGTVLTAPSPADHPWHRGLWFSWKMLNGVNYWEEDPSTGKAQGLTDVRATKVTPKPDGSAAIDLEVTYHPVGADPVLSERRRIEIGAADKYGAYRIDWRSEFTAGGKDVLLQGGTAGGGYAGLSVRISQASRDWILIDSEARRDIPMDSNPQNAGGMAANTHGKRAKWMDFSMVDGNTGHTGGIAILEHPSNPRHPSQWHNVMAANSRFGYFSPAMLWSQPYTLPARQRLTLRYRILVHPGRPDRDSIGREWRSFASQP